MAVRRSQIRSAFVPIRGVVRRISILSLIFLAVAPAWIAQAEEQQGAFSELSAGADVSENVWALYTGATIAPGGSIHADGLRLRATTGVGGYSYSRTARHRAQVTFADVMAGYQLQFGALTSKVFAGVHAVDHTIRPLDPLNALSGTEYGAAGSIELWLNMGDTGWASLDAGYADVNDAAFGRLRLGYRLAPGLSIGPEASINDTYVDITQQWTEYRGGAFVRLNWSGGELSASGGASTNELSSGMGAPDAYLTVNWLTKY